MQKDLHNAFNEHDIRPPNLMVDKEKYLIADREFLLARKNQWVNVGCPACGSAESETYGDKNGFRYAECLDCETVYTNPRPTQETLNRFYKNSKNYEYWNRHIFPTTEEVRRIKIFRPRAERIRSICHKMGIHGGTLLEVGAGFGIF